MLYGIYQSGGGMQVNEYRMNVLANNMANLETVGFKHDLTVVRERMVESRESMGDAGFRHECLDNLTGGSLVAPTHTAFIQGPLEITGGDLDAAIEGDGFFMVEHPDGVRYTRDGRFTVNGDGMLVTVAGNLPVLDESGSPIMAGDGAKAAIDGNGNVLAGENVVGKLGTVNFDDKSLLRKTGENLIQSLGAQASPVDAAIRAGALERSTVDPTLTMVKMIEVQRAYEMNARMVGLADSTLARAVNDIGRIQ